MLLCKLVQALMCCSGVNSSPTHLSHVLCSCPHLQLPVEGRCWKEEWRTPGLPSTWEDHIVTLWLPPTSAWDVLISDHPQRKMPCLWGMKALSKLCSGHGQLLQGACGYLLQVHSEEQEDRDSLHLWAALPTAIFSQHKGSPNSRHDDGKGLPCRSGPHS